MQRTLLMILTLACLTALGCGGSTNEVTFPSDPVPMSSEADEQIVVEEE